MKEEDWINQIMDGLDHLPKAKPSPEFLSSLESTFSKPKVISLNKNQRNSFLWFAAASVVILFLINFNVVQSEFQSMNNAAAEEIISDYGLDETSNYYNLEYYEQN